MDVTICQDPFAPDDMAADDPRRHDGGVIQDVEQDVARELEALTVKELRALAKALGLTGYGAMKKDDLADAVSAAQDAASDAEEAEATESPTDDPDGAENAGDEPVDTDETED